MATFQGILSAAGVQETLIHKLVEDGWTIELFSMSASSLDKFDAELPEILGNLYGSATSVQRSALRLAWTKCRSRSIQAPVPHRASTIGDADVEQGQAAPAAPAAPPARVAQAAPAARTTRTTRAARTAPAPEPVDDPSCEQVAAALSVCFPVVGCVTWCISQANHKEGSEKKRWGNIACVVASSSVLISFLVAFFVHLSRMADSEVDSGYY